MGFWGFIEGASRVYKNLGVGKYCFGENRRKEETHVNPNPPSKLETALKILSIASIFVPRATTSSPQISSNISSSAQNESAGCLVYALSIGVICFLGIGIGYFFDYISTPPNNFVQVSPQLRKVNFETPQPAVMPPLFAEPSPVTTPAPQVVFPNVGETPARGKTAQEEYEEGVVAYHENNFAKAFSLFSSAAGKNHVPAQYNLGCMYKNGDGIEQDLDVATEWFIKAMKNGHQNAKMQIKEIYIYKKSLGK